MAKKGTKATRKFAASGQLTKKIQARRKHQQIQRKVNKNKNARSKGQERPHVDADENDDEEESAKENKSLKKRYAIPLSRSGRYTQALYNPRAGM
jgi:nucleolar complex protein 2